MPLCGGEPVSVAFTVKLEVPATVGVPLTRPVEVFRVRPAGSEPDIERPVVAAACRRSPPASASRRRPRSRREALVVVTSSGRGRRGRGRSERAADRAPVRQLRLVERHLPADDAVRALEPCGRRCAEVPRRVPEVGVLVLEADVAVLLERDLEGHRPAPREREVRHVEPLQVQRAVRRRAADSGIDPSRCSDCGGVEVVPERRDESVRRRRGGHRRIEVSACAGARAQREEAVGRHVRHVVGLAEVAHREADRERGEVVVAATGGREARARADVDPGERRFCARVVHGRRPRDRLRRRRATGTHGRLDGERPGRGNREGAAVEAVRARRGQRDRRAVHGHGHVRETGRCRAVRGEHVHR